MSHRGHLWTGCKEILLVLEPVFSFMKGIEGDTPVIGMMYNYASTVSTLN